MSSLARDSSGSPTATNTPELYLEEPEYPEAGPSTTNERNALIRPRSSPSPEQQEESTDGPPKKRRRRSAIACFPCRQRKRACDSQKPECKLCRQGGYDCTWPERDLRRKRSDGLVLSATINGDIASVKSRMRPKRNAGEAEGEEPGEDMGRAERTGQAATLTSLSLHQSDRTLPQEVPSTSQTQNQALDLLLDPLISGRPPDPDPSHLQPHLQYRVQSPTRTQPQHRLSSSAQSTEHLFAIPDFLLRQSDGPSAGPRLGDRTYPLDRLQAALALTRQHNTSNTVDDGSKTSFMPGEGSAGQGMGGGFTARPNQDHYGGSQGGVTLRELAGIASGLYTQSGGSGYMMRDMDNDQTSRRGDNLPGHSRSLEDHPNVNVNRLSGGTFEGQSGRNEARDSSDSFAMARFGETMSAFDQGFAPKSGAVAFGYGAADEILQQPHQSGIVPGRSGGPLESSKRPLDQDEPPQSLDTTEIKDGALDGLSYEYLRPYGTTAIQPGLGRVRLSIRGNPNTRNRNASSSQIGESPMSNGPPSVPSQPPELLVASGMDLVETRTRLPIFSVRKALLDDFFANFKELFPFVDRDALDTELLGKPSLGTVLMVNGMCALSARFCTHPEIVSLSPFAFCRGVQFADTAKVLLIPLLGLPSHSTTAALLFLSWYAFGLNSEGELWQYSGMALRMAVDLGFHRKLGNRKTRKADRTLFWCIYLLDRTLAIGTGRPTSIPDSQIDIPDPVNDSELLAGAPFAYAIRFFIMYGEVADVANSCGFWSKGQPTGSAVNTRAPSPALPGANSPRQARPNGYRVHFPESESRPVSPTSGVRKDGSSSVFSQADLALLSKLEDKIMATYDSLPHELTWSVENFEKHAAAGHGDMFLHLHLWYHCIVAILYREPLMQSRASAAGISCEEAKVVQQFAASSIREIAESLSSDQDRILRNPFINQCFYTAASTWVSELRTIQQTGNRAVAKARSQIFSQALRNFQSNARLLKRQSEVWSGVGWIAAALAKRSAGTSLQDLVVKRGVVDTILSEAEMRILSTDPTPDQPDQDHLMFSLRDDLLQTLGGASNEFGVAPGEPMLWGANGLFDEEMERLLYGFQTGGDGFFSQSQGDVWV